MGRFVSGVLVGGFAASLAATAVWTTVKIGPTPEQRMCVMRAGIERSWWSTQRQQAVALRRMEADQRVRAAELALTWSTTSDPVQRAHKAGMAAEFVAHTETSAEDYRRAAERHEAEAFEAAERAMRQCLEMLP